MTVTLRQLGTGLVFLAALTAMTVAGHWHAQRSLTSDINRHLQQHLPQKLKNAELYSFDDWVTKAHIIDSIETDLSKICSTSPLKVLNSCHIKVLGIGDYVVSQTMDKARWKTSITTANRDTFFLGLYYKTNWSYLIASQLLLLSACWWLTRVVLHCECAFFRKWTTRLGRAFGSVSSETPEPDIAIDAELSAQPPVFQSLHHFGLDQKTSQAVARDPRLLNLTEEQKAWLYQALQMGDHTIDKAFQVALAEPKLLFYPREAKINIHGIDIALPRTPFIYYYWYAMRRCSTSGEGSHAWFINPPVNRADSVHSAQLVALLKRYGGHGKAINDLETKGLRAKTLDQNRSKIKAELTRVLGQSLAEDYLFDVERDNRTARYRYRITTAPECIRLNAPEPARKGPPAKQDMRLSPAA